MLASSSVNAEVIAAVVLASIALIGLLGTTRGRAWARSLFKGQSLETMAATMADQMAGVQAAYAVSESERHRLETKVQAQETEIADLRKQIEFLGTIVTARDEIRKLSDMMNGFGRELEAIGRTVDRLAQ